MSIDAIISKNGRTFRNLYTLSSSVILHICKVLKTIDLKAINCQVMTISVVASIDKLT